MRIKKILVISIFYGLGFISAFSMHQYIDEKNLVGSDTWILYNPLKRTMVKLLDDAKSCRPNDDIEIWYKLLKSSAKDLYQWHTDRIDGVYFVDTEEYLEAHKSSYEHSVHYVGRIEQIYSRCEF